VAVERESTDVASDNIAGHHSNAVDESSLTANHAESSDRNQCVDNIIYC